MNRTRDDLSVLRTVCKQQNRCKNSAPAHVSLSGKILHALPTKSADNFVDTCCVILVVVVLVL